MCVQLGFIRDKLPALRDSRSKMYTFIQSTKIIAAYFKSKTANFKTAQEFYTFCKGDLYLKETVTLFKLHITSFSQTMLIKMLTKMGFFS